MTATKKKEPAQGLHIRVRNVLGVEDVELDLVPGDLNVVEGEGGIGKTSTLLAIAAALTGRAEEVSVRDGADVGLVSVQAKGEDARTLTLSANGRARTAGDSPIGVADIRALAILVHGDNAVSVEAKNKARIKALMQIVKAPLTEPDIDRLTELDPELGGWLRNLAESATMDILAAATALQKEIQRLARIKEGEADGLTGEAEAAFREYSGSLALLRELGVDAPIADPDPAAAELKVRERVGKLALVKHGAERRAAEEARRAALAEAHGERPSVEAEQESLDLATAREAEAGVEVVRLRSLRLGAVAECNAFESSAGGVKGGLINAYGAMAQRVKHLDKAFGLEESDGWPPVEANDLIGKLQLSLEALTEHVGKSHRAQCCLADLSAAAGKAEQAHEAAVAAYATRRDGTLYAQKALREAQARLDTWQATADLLAAPIEGETAADVEAAEGALAGAEHNLKLHQLSAAALAHHDRAEAAGKNAEKAAARGAELRARNTAVPLRVADCLAKVGASGFTVVGGMLAFRQDGGEPIDFDSRMSPSMKTRAALDLVADKWGGLVILDPVWVWTYLDDAGRRFLREYAASRPDILLAVEHAISGPVVAVTGANARLFTAAGEGL